jgi:hypothetical protein
MTRLFTILSFIGFGFLIVGLNALYKAGWPPALFSGPFWFCVLLIAAELVFIVLAIKFALTEKTIEQPPHDHDPRKLY